ncbi:MAG TPA: hypothetical protein VM434_17540 [Beijerinckiaceae bacterium]|nr:hypothetical protein [Beijerinckiaceae bacterium]
MRALFWIAIYFGIGALMHAIFLAPTFDWSSAMTWAWLTVWPLMLLAKIIIWGVIAAVVIWAAVALWERVRA